MCIPRAGELHAAIGAAVNLASARSLDSFHLARAARHLPSIPARRHAIFHRSGTLIAVENLVAAIKRFRVNAPILKMACRSVAVRRICTLFGRRAFQFVGVGAFCLL